MQTKNKITYLNIVKHAICYLISFGGLYAFFILLSLICQAFPSFTALDVNVQNIIVQVLAYGFTFVAIIIYLYNIALKDILNQFKNLQNIASGFLYGAGLLVGTIIIGIICQTIGNLIGAPVTPNENEEAINNAALSLPLLTCLMTIIFAPVTEEIGYRFGIFGGIHQYNRWLAYIVTSLIFALIHTNFDTGNFVNELLNLPSYIFAGAWLCFTYERSGSIVTSITAHMTNNLVAFLLSVL